MTRRLLNLLTALSLILCVATVVLWAQSYASSAGWYLSRDGGYSEFAWVSGEFYVSHGASVGNRCERQQWGRSPGLHGFSDASSSYRPSLLREARYVTAANRLAWSPIRDDKGIIASYRTLRLPCWAPAIAFAFLPAVTLARRIRSRRRDKIGLCEGCGYDLTANASGVCPECGRAT